VIVSYGITPVDATPDDDYVATPAVRTVTIPAEQFGPTTSPFVTITNDIITEPTETLKLEIVSVAFADSSAFPGIRNYERNAYDFDTTLWTVTTDPFAVGTIFDDDKRQVTLTALPPLPSLKEGNDYYNLFGNLTLYPVTLTYTGKTNSLAPFEVIVDAIDGTAAFSDDYNYWDTQSSRTYLVAFAGTVGEVQTIYMLYYGDWTVEADETFLVRATNIYHSSGNSGVTIDTSANTAQLWIPNDDAAEVSVNERLLTGNSWYISEGNMDDPVVEIPLHLSQAVDVPVRVEFTIAGLGGYNLPATVPATNATGFVTPVRGTDDISDLPNAQWDNTAGVWWVTIPANTTAGVIQVKVLSDTGWETTEDIGITLVGITDLPPATGRTGKLTVSTTKNTARLVIWNDD
ncbi:MAG: hypothetical protein IAF94_07900, partial [Pirellulaceae bacterium]|nr:hypothetical protein [Pirellulaceae bacterium]